MRKQDLKNAAIAVILLMGVLLGGSGYIDVPINALGMERLAESNDRYLERSMDKAVNGFLILSGIKTGLAVIEGSEVGVGFNLELGDIVQSVYDYVDIAWKTALAGGTVVLLTRLVLQAVRMVDHWCFTFTAAALLLYGLLRWFLPAAVKSARLLREAAYFLLIATIVTYLVFPFSIAGAAYLSEKITGPLIEESQRSFESIKEEFSSDNISRRLFPDEVKEENSWIGSFWWRKKIASITEQFEKQAAYFKEKSKNIAIWTLQLIAGYLFDGIVFPITFFILLFVVVKGAMLYLLEERRQQSLKEELRTMADKFYSIETSGLPRQPSHIRRYRRYPRYSRRRL